MGHVRVGRLPRTLRWREVIALLDEPESNVASVADAVLVASTRRLRELADDPAVGYPLWLLARLAAASRGPAFLDELPGGAAALRGDSPSLAVIAALTDHVREHLSGEAVDRDHLTEIAIQAFRESLTATVARESRSLFEADAADLQRAFRTYSTNAGFAELCRRFLANFTLRTVRSFVERDLSNHIGSQRAIPTTEDAEDFGRALDHHIWQASKIVQQFAGDWFSKHNYESGGQISPEEVQAFAAVALRKLRGELQRGARA